METKNFTKLSFGLSQYPDPDSVIVACCNKTSLTKILHPYVANFTDGMHDLVIDDAVMIVDKFRILFLNKDKENNNFKIGAKLASVAQTHKLRNISFVCDMEPDHLLQIVEACALRYPEFIKYKTNNSKREETKITFVVDDPNLLQSRLDSLIKVVDSVLEARSVVNSAPNHMRPSDLATEAKKLEQFGIKCRVLEGDELNKMECLVAVGKGSTDKSKLIVLELIKNNSDPLISLVGKGVTFDSGGYSIKPAKSMQEMHSDMSGAATVLGIMSVAAKLNLDVNLVAAIPCAENMISGDAMRPEDVYTSYSGQTVHVLNTDAEGRLILADALSYMQEQYKPSIMLDFATLTAAIVMALGDVFTGAYSNDDELFKVMEKAGQNTFERIWRMPLCIEYAEMMDSKFADMKNVSDGSGGGSANAAAFLGKFVNDPIKWMHFDIAGTAFLQKAGVFSSLGATGVGIRMVLEALKDIKTIL